MKIHHCALLFLIFFLAVIIKTDRSIGKLKAIEIEKAELTDKLNSATSDAVEFLVSSNVYGGNTINKETLVSTFFTSLYTSMGIISDPSAQAELEMYIPVILLCDYDGYYVYYYDKFKADDGLTYSQRIWSEKLPYYYKDSRFIYRFTLSDMVCIYDINGLLDLPQKVIVADYHEFQKGSVYENFRSKYRESILLNDEAFELVKRGAIINQLEKSLSYYTSKHNEIAQQNGITYCFSYPTGSEEEWAKYMDDVNMLVVFQGYPYGGDSDYTFNKIASAGGNIIKKPVYFVEKRGWYYLAHIKECPELAAGITVLDETFESKEACAQIGAYCHECIEYGARVPILN
jgi:hypothetical protein